MSPACGCAGRRRPRWKIRLPADSSKLLVSQEGRPTMILYGASLSPYVRKVLVFAAEKGIELESVPVGRTQPDAEFAAISPFGKMPALRDGEFSVPDSSAIVHYLEAKQPDPALIPSDPQARARTIWFDEYADTILFDCGRKMFFNRIVAPLLYGREGDMEAAAEGERELPRVLDYLESVIPESGFLVGDRLTLADIAVASPLVNLVHLGVDFRARGYAKIAGFAEAMLGRPSFRPWVERESEFLRKRAA